MNQPDTEQMDEQLTAYLDGELTPQESAALEQSLVGDEKLRLRLAELRKAYDLLDEIPETPHNQRFTKSTMELVIKDLTASEPQTARSTTFNTKPTIWLTWPRFAAVFVGLLVTGALAAYVVNQVMVHNDLSNLGLYAGIRGLQDVSDLEIAVRLSQETEVLNVLKERFGENLLPPPPVSAWERKDWLRELTPLQVSRLNSGKDMIQKMDANSRTRWSSLESKIEARTDSKQIQEAIYAVGMIRARARDELAGMNREERFSFIRKELCFMAAMHYTLHMPPSDAKALSEWNTHSLNSALIQENPNSRWNETQMLLGRMLFFSKVRFERQGELIEELLPTLTKTGAKILDGINNDEEQLLILFFWLFPERFPSDQSSLELYEKLDAKGISVKESLQRIDLGDPHDFKRNLESLRSRL